MGILVLNSKQSEAMKQLGHDEELRLNGLAGSDPLNANKFNPLSLKPAPESFHETILQAYARRLTCVTQRLTTFMLEPPLEGHHEAATSKLANVNRTRAPRRRDPKTPRAWKIPQAARRSESQDLWPSAGWDFSRRDSACHRSSARFPQGLEQNV